MNLKRVILIVIFMLLANQLNLFSAPSLQKVKKVSIVKNLDKKITKTTIYYRSNDVTLQKQSEVKSVSTNYTIAPNPAEDYIEISFGNKGLQPFANSGEIAIYDVLGNEVWKSNYVPSQTTHRVVSTTGRIDISHLPRGIYFVKFGGNVKKFIKN